MRKGVLTVTAAVVILSLVAASQLPLEKPLSSLQRPDPSFPQIGVMPVKQGSNDQSPAFDPNGGVKQTLGDALTIGRKAGLWWEYARDVATVVSQPLRFFYEALSFGEGQKSLGKRSSVDNSAGTDRLGHQETAKKAVSCPG